jgi:hypothetical protein
MDLNKGRKIPWVHIAKTSVVRWSSQTCRIEPYGDVADGGELGGSPEY